MKRIGTEGVVLRLEEIRQHVLPPPPGVATLAPAIVILDLATHVDHGVDRRTAAQALAARIPDGTPVQTGIGLGEVAPVRARVVDGVEVADRDVDPDVVVGPARSRNSKCPGLGSHWCRPIVVYGPANAVFQRDPVSLA